MQASRYGSTQPLSTSMLTQLVTFELFGEVFALPILDVREVIHMAAITPVPHAPSFVEGVLNLRGQILPVVDLRRRFGIPPENATDDTRIVVVELASNIIIGLIVDAVREVESIPSEQILPPPSLIAGSIGAEYIRGISNHATDDGAHKMIIHIDLRRVFSLEELNALEATTA